MTELVDVADLKSVGCIDLGSSSLPVGTIFYFNMKFKNITGDVIEDLVICLEEHYPNLDIFSISLSHLKSIIIDINFFEDDIESYCNQRKLEAILIAWDMLRQDR